MGERIHPDEALFGGERRFPAIPACDHYAGTERRMLKALRLQAERGPLFDLTLDLEDGAPAGREEQHAELVVELLRGEENVHGRVGARIHDPSSPHWPRDVETLVSGAGERLAYLTIPKATAARQVAEVTTAVQRACSVAGLEREIPLHVLIETHGALAEVHKIAGLPWVRGLDFGLMDFVSAHHGAIPAEAMTSPGQFEHRLVARAKTEIVSAALAHGVVPVHNVTTGFDDVERTASDARRARREFGFLRMWSIHPSQIDPILEAFAPDEDDVRTGCALLLAASDADWAPIRFEGRLHDRASYRFYWQVVSRAALAPDGLPDEVRAAFFADVPV